MNIKLLLKKNWLIRMLLDPPRLFRFYLHVIKNNLIIKLKYRDAVRFGFSSRVAVTSKFEGANRVSPGAQFDGSMGYGSYVGHRSSVCAHIGRFTSIAPDVMVNHGMHPYKEPNVTTCPMFFSTLRQNGHTFASENVFEEFKEFLHIGNDVWIGQRVFLAGGITIGDGAVVLAGATVVKDVPPYAIVGGVPAKVVGYRYDEDTIRWLLQLRWWDNDINWLKQNWRMLNDMDKLKEYFGYPEVRKDK